MKPMSEAKLAAAAVAVALALSGGMNAAQAGTTMQKCYGITKAGQNDCADAYGSHSCKGKSKTDNNAADWKMVIMGTCISPAGGLPYPLQTKSIVPSG